MAPPPAVETSELPPPKLIIGVGSSAGGLEALKALFSRAQPSAGLCWIVVQHLDPSHESLMVELLSRHTELPVQFADDQAPLRADCIYIIAPGTLLTVEEGRLRVRPIDDPLRSLRPVSILFESIARGYGARGSLIVLSGTGSDGSAALTEASSAGCTILAQSPSDAQFDGMPRAAIATGVVDVVVQPRYMPQILTDRLQRVPSDRRPRGPDVTSEDQVEIASAPLDQLMLDYTGVDLAHYKREGIERRFQQRVERTAHATDDDYLQTVRHDMVERAALADALFIHVTSFFRDPEVWERLRTDVLPDLVRTAKAQERPLRMWSAGTSYGHEAYTLAMLLHRTFEDLSIPANYRIFATDINPRALEAASRGIYSQEAAKAVPAPYRSTLMHRVSQGLQVSIELRNRVLFTQHDLISDPPFHNLDLVICRNLLIYLRDEVQQRALTRMAYGLRVGGVLLLGAAESHEEIRTIVEPIDRRARLFRKSAELPTDQRHQALLSRFRRRTVPVHKPVARGLGHRERTAVSAIYNALAEELDVAILGVDAGHQLVYSVGDTQPFSRRLPGAISMHLDAVLVEPLGALCQVAIRRARDAGLTGSGGQVTVAGRTVQVTARILPGDPEISCLILLRTRADRAPSPHEADDASASSAIRALQRDLASTQDSLQSAIEELEASNEELQASNQELIASNEAFQSNAEELQSLNEELHSINAEHQDKIDQLMPSNADLDTLIDATDVGIVFLDNERGIRRFNVRAAQELHLVPSDIGRPLRHFARFGTIDLDALSEQALGTVEVIEAFDPTGGHLVRCHSFAKPGREGPQLILTLVDLHDRLQAERDLQALLDALPQQVAVLDAEGQIVRTNHPWGEFARANGGRSDTAGVGRNYLEVTREAATTDPYARRALEGLESVLSRAVSSFAMDYPCHGPSTERWFHMQIAPIDHPRSGAVISHSALRIDEGAS